MTSVRKYHSPKREAKALATRTAIIEAFAEQLSQPGRDTISPHEAAVRAGVSVRTVHHYFPNEASQVAALGEWFDKILYPQGVELAAGPDDLPRYFREIHRLALLHPISRLLASDRRGVWRDVRKERRSKRLEAIRQSILAIGAPEKATEETTAMLLSLSGADASWPLHDYGLPIEQIPDVIANTVALLVDQLRENVTK